MSALPDRNNRETFAFIRKGPVPIANEQVAAHLQMQFPDYDLETIDLTAWLRNRPATLARALLAACMAYGPEILTKRRSAKTCLWQTTYVNQKVKQLMAHKAQQPPSLAFTFQMQSLFDASVPGIPHFLYTDHTNLANRHYPHVDDNVFYPRHSRLVEQAAFDHAARIFTRSHHVTRSVIEDYHTDPAKVHCVYAGSNVPLDDIAPLGQRRLLQQAHPFCGHRLGAQRRARACRRIL